METEKSRILKTVEKPVPRQRISPFSGGRELVVTERNMPQKHKKFYRGHKKPERDPLFFADPLLQPTEIDDELAGKRREWVNKIRNKVAHKDKRRLDEDFLRATIKTGRDLHISHQRIADILGFDIEIYIDLHTKLLGSEPKEEQE